jgi:deazaflavin-dependent oxidoreductase (nitroreductase family)
MSSQPGRAAANQVVVENFRQNGGLVTIPPFVGASLLLLTTIGATSGLRRTVPLGYSGGGERYVVVGLDGGGPRVFAWVHNVRVHPIVTVEVGTETFEARATVTEGAERRRLFDAHAAAIPIFAEFERQAPREMPVVTLERIEAS